MTLHLNLGVAVLLIATASETIAQQTAPASPQARPPNVLFIVIDDLNDWVGCLDGSTGVKTPNIDRLAKRGMLFTQAYCASPSCNPSRTSLLTGIRPSTSGVYINRQSMRKAMPDAVTLLQHFRAHGYHVASGGKIFHSRYPDPASWDEHFKSPPDLIPPNVPVNHLPGLDWAPLEADDEQTADMKVVRWAEGVLRRKHDKPLFLAVGIVRPHLPWYLPKKYFDRYDLADIVLPRVKRNDLNDVPAPGRRMARPDGDHRRILQARKWKQAVRAYLASITFADVCVGRLMDTLDAGDLADNTIVVLWSDHGWHLGEKRAWRKFTLWEESTHVPLIITAPGLRPPNWRCARPVSLIDVYPTLTELAGLPPNKKVEGVSLLPLLRDPTATWNRAVVTTAGPGNHAVRSEHYRYIRYSDGSEELYNHDNDPMEWKNVAKDARYAQVKRKLAQWLPKINAPYAPKDPKRPAAQ